MQVNVGKVASFMGKIIRGYNNRAQPRKFCAPKITRYTVLHYPHPPIAFLDGDRER